MPRSQRVIRTYRWPNDHKCAFSLFGATAQMKRRWNRYFPDCLFSAVNCLTLIGSLPCSCWCFGSADNQACQITVVVLQPYIRKSPQHPSSIVHRVSACICAAPLLEVEHYSALHFALRHLLKNRSQVFHLLRSQPSLDYASCCHIQDLESLSLVTHCRPLNIVFHCHHRGWKCLSDGYGVALITLR